MSSTPNSTVEASTTSSSPASCMASNNNAPKYGTRVPNRVFVGGLSAETTEAEMEALFSNYGTVSSVKIISDRAGVSKGYGFITFETEEQARNLLRIQEVYLKNRKLNIAPAIKKQYDLCGTLQPGSYGRTYDVSSPSVPSGSVYYSNPAVPYAPIQTNGISYYPTAVVSQQDAYAAVANATYTQAAQASNAAAANAHAYSGYPYIYPASAAAQAMYATPQQYSAYQAMQPQSSSGYAPESVTYLPSPPPLPSQVMHNNTNQSPPPPTSNSVVNPFAATFSSPPSLQATTHSYIMGDMHFAMPFTVMSMQMTEQQFADTTNNAGDAQLPAASEDQEQQPVSSEIQMYYDPICFTTPPPPIMMPATTTPSSSCNGDVMPNIPPFPYVSAMWSPVTPPPTYYASPEQHRNGYRGRGRGARRGGRGGRGGRYQQQRYGPGGDTNSYQSQSESSQRQIDGPPRYPSTSPEQDSLMCTNNNEMPPDLVKMVQALQVNN